MLSKQIRIRRVADGVSAADLAKRAGISIVTLYNYEQGRCSPSVKVLTKLAKAFNVSEGELLSDKIVIDLT